MIGIVGISRIRMILAALTAAVAALIVAVATPAQASTTHYAGCTKVSGVWVLGVDPNGYMCAIQFREGNGIAYLRMTGETGTYTWYRVGARTTLTGTQIQVSSPNAVYAGVNNGHPYLYIPGKPYAYITTAAYSLLKTAGGLGLRLTTNGLVSNFPIKKVAPPGATAPIAFG